MKRLMFMTLWLFITATTFAQQALWGGSQIISPEIHDDYSVTFRIRAPKAVKVEITGDFLPPQLIDTPFGKFEAPGEIGRAHV